ncbi:putative UV damage endonuclease [Clostridium botulinum A1 str. CFSAN002368]|nr:putative UV damage endonuclease [Clostridium botulinum A1 str. CFSAN002368]
MRIGYACTPITIDAKNSRSFMLKIFL